MTPLGIHDDDAAVRTEAVEVSLALAGALEDAGLRLPQFAAGAGDGDHLIRLGACNVRVGRALYHLVRDGLTLRARYPEESVHAQP
ncbi:hypothetical protein AB0912_31520 [Streptomyces sp. NPDC007084]|uniref:hypothetical protein n=1 Tax=Streptomyces sp. NPDC007084 TaxID=3154313 RepID=UPI003453C3AD